MNAIPTLSVSGFTTNNPIIMLKLFEHFKCSDYSQSNIFYGDIASLKYLIAESSGGDDLKDMCIKTLTKMYTKYFPIVNVDVSLTETDAEIKLDINILTTDHEGVNHQLAEIIALVDNKITNFDTLQEKLYESRQ